MVCPCSIISYITPCLRFWKYNRDQDTLSLFPHGAHTLLGKADANQMNNYLVNIMLRATMEKYLLLGTASIRVPEFIWKTRETSDEATVKPRP